MYGRTVSFLARAGSINPALARAELIGHVVRLFIFFFTEATLTLGFVSMATRAVDRATRRLRERLFEKTFGNDVGYFDREGRDRIEQNITVEIQTVRDTIWANLSKDRGIRAVIEVVFGLLICLSITGIAGLPVFAMMVPILSVTSARVGMRNGRLAFNVNRQESRVRGFVSERIGGLRTLKAYGAERKESKAFRGVLSDVEQISKKSSFSRALSESTSRLTIYTTMMAYLTLGGLMICSGRMTYALFACLTGYIWNLNFCVAGLSFTLSDSSKLSNSLRSIYSVLDNATSYHGNSLQRGTLTAHSSPEKFMGNVEFRSVYFHYPSRQNVSVLKGISFTMKPGDMVALVGASGGGKSTIAALLSRMYASTLGQISLDGLDIQNIPPEVYAKQIAVVEQDPVLFQGTIRDNIAYGRPNDVVDDSEVIRAAKEANAHEFISKLPHGYDTIWSPGSNMSGGQRQRIAIARSLVKSPCILILDEATSALDQESERLVQTALERIMRNRSVLLIAHRLSTVRAANKILVVGDGRILEQGNYEELVAMKNGYFRTLVQSATNFVDRKASF
ncbi:unnamed protein product [Agarophyton chilense]